MRTNELKKRIQHIEAWISAAYALQASPSCICGPVFYHSYAELFAMVNRACPVHGLRDITPMRWVPSRSSAVPSGECLCETNDNDTDTCKSVFELNRQFQVDLAKHDELIANYLKKLRAHKRGSKQTLGIHRARNYYQKHRKRG
jgi:hypothetical protein